jgi:hypothetical protein
MSEPAVLFDIGVPVRMDTFGGGVTWRFDVDCEWKSGGRTALLVGGESKFGSTEDKGISGDPVDNWWTMGRFELHSHIRSSATTTNDAHT